jgi:hypothetical protein
MKLLTEYESVTKKVLLPAKYNFLNYSSIFREQCYFIVPCLNIMGHGNPDNNLKSHCALILILFPKCVVKNRANYAG